jgi:hypothetical protein
MELLARPVSGSLFAARCSRPRACRSASPPVCHISPGKGSTCCVESFVEESTTDDSAAEVAAARLGERAVDVLVGGIYGSTRQASRRLVVAQAETLYIYPEQYEGHECHP